MSVESRSLPRLVADLYLSETMSSVNAIIHSQPDILGGAPVFVGTRVPVKALWDYLETGQSIDTFLDHFPTVKRDQALAALEIAREKLTEHARAA